MSPSVSIKCPVEACSKTKEMELPDVLFQKQRGMAVVPIHKGEMCEHEFIAFISKDSLKVRGYEIIDTVVNIDQLKKTESEKFYLATLLSKYGILATGAILHAVLLDIHIIILRSENEKNLTSRFINLLMNFLPEQFKNHLIRFSHVIESDYQEEVTDNSVIISPTGIIANTPWDQISDNFERNLIKNALEIIDPESQFILIQEEFRKILEQAKYIADIIEKKDIFENDLKSKIKKKFSVIMSNNDVKLLKHIITFRFKKDTSRIKIKSLSKLTDGLW